MKHALFCWEYGAGMGHIGSHKMIARRLKANGWTTSLINPSNVELTADAAFDSILTLPQAKQLNEFDFTELSKIRSQNRVVTSFGYGSDKFVFGRLKLWSRLYDMTDPTLVVADYAPAALMAARGRFPTIAVGNGFTLPPANLTSYPSFFRAKDPTDATQLLDNVNSALRLARMPTLRYLPEMFHADFSACTTLEIADVYRRVRKDPVISLLCDQPIARADVSGKHEIFVYLTHCRWPMRRLVIEALVKVNQPTKVFSLQYGADDAELVSGSNIHFVKEPVPLNTIIKDSRFVIHLGSHSLALQLLVAGMPSLNLTIDIEKVVNGSVLKQAGLISMTSLPQIKSVDSLVETIQSALGDSGLVQNVTEFADNLPADTCERALNTIHAAANRLTS